MEIVRDVTSFCATDFHRAALIVLCVPLNRGVKTTSEVNLYEFNVILSLSFANKLNK